MTAAASSPASSISSSSCTATAPSSNCKKSLHWAASVVSEVVHIPATSSAAAKEKLWYTKQDFKLFKKQTKRIVQYIRRGEQGHIPFNTMLDEDRYCSRGIEHLVTWESSMIRDHRVDLSRQVVFMEQLLRNSLSLSSSPSSPEAGIARVYKNITDPLQLVAYQRGLEDSRDAQLIYLEATATKNLLLSDGDHLNDSLDPSSIDLPSDIEEDDDDDSSLNNFFELDFESWNDGDFAVTPTMKKMHGTTTPQSLVEAMVEPLVTAIDVAKVDTTKSATRCRSITDISNEIDVIHLHPHNEGRESLTRLNKRARTMPVA